MTTVTRSTIPTQQDPSPQHDPSQCPPWCHREHLLEADTGDGFHHDGEPIAVMPAFRQVLNEQDTILVKPSLFVPLDGSSRSVLVELLDGFRMVAGLSPAEARELAQNLHDAATLAEGLPQNHREEAAGPALASAEDPFWLTQPCPAWCSGGHEASDDPDDRKHWSASDGHRLQLTLLGLERKPDNSGWYDDPPVLDVYMVQQVLEAEPRVVVAVNEAQGTDLTLAEAKRLADALQNLIQTATGTA